MEEAGSEGKDCIPLDSGQTLLAPQSSWISKHIIILTFFYIVCTDEWEISIETRGLTLMLTSNIAGVENGVNKETKFHYKFCPHLLVQQQTSWVLHRTDIMELDLCIIVLIVLAMYHNPEGFMAL